MWSQVVLVTDDDLGAMEPQATDKSRPWGRDTWPIQRALAKKEIRVWIDVAFPTIVSASDRVVDRWALTHVFESADGAALTQDWQAQARDDNEDDVPLGLLLASTTARVIIGAPWTYDGIYCKVSTPNAVASVLGVEYYGPSGWATVAVDDGTAIAGVTLAQAGRIRFTNGPPTDWEPVRLSQGDEFLWTRLGVSVALTAGARASQLAAIRPDEALKQCAAWLTLAYIKRGLADGASDPEYWRTSANEYEQKAKNLFQSLRDGGLTLDIDRTGVVVPEQETAISPLRLARG